VRLWLVVNPRAGGGRGARVLGHLLPLLRAEGLEPTVHVCASADEPAVATRAAIADGAEVVVAIGGDGHASAIADVIVGTAVRMAVVPAGSADDYARALGVRGSDLRSLARLIARGEARPVDVMRAELGGQVRHVLTVGGAGFDAQVAGRAMGISRLRGAPRYLAALLAELPHFAASEFAIEVDGQRREMPAMLVAVANGSTYGGGMRVAPAAHLQSGSLEVCIIGALSRAGFMRAFPSVFLGRHVGHPKVTMLRGRDVSIAADRVLGVMGDGERLGALPARFSVVPGALSVIAHPDARMA
jgi:diacylglycerol kinase (ATP)